LNNGGWINGYNERDLIDLNGDRLPDLIGFINETVYVSLNQNGTLFAPAQEWCTGNFSLHTNNSQYKLKSFLDVNNDGFIDLVMLISTGLFVLFNNNGTKFNQPYLVSNLINQSEANFVPYLVDINADGFIDYVSISNQSSYYYLNLNSINSSLSTYNVANSLVDNNLWNLSSTQRSFADVNNDGLPDLVGFNSQNVTIGLADSNGNQLNISLSGVYAFNNTNALFSNLIDMNNDGYLDAVSFTCAGVFVSFGVGNGILANNPILWTDTITTCNNSQQRYLIDVDGNLSPDIVSIDQNSALSVFFSNGNNVPIVNQMIDSLNYTINIQFGFQAEEVNNITDTTGFLSEKTEMYSQYGLIKEIVQSVQRSSPNLINSEITTRTAVYTYGINQY
jgi:hypothetical protein